MSHRATSRGLTSSICALARRAKQLAMVRLASRGQSASYRTGGQCRRSENSDGLKERHNDRLNHRMLICRSSYNVDVGYLGTRSSQVFPASLMMTSMFRRPYERCLTAVPYAAAQSMSRQVSRSQIATIMFSGKPSTAAHRPWHCELRPAPS
jgi:hypothetical protein